MLNQKEINLFNNGDRIDHYFFISKSEIKKTRNNDEYIFFEFADKKSSINANLWKDKKEFEQLKELYLKGNLTGRIIKVQGEIREFNNNLSINIESIRLAVDDDKITIKDFMKTSERPICEMKDEFKRCIDEYRSRERRFGGSEWVSSSHG